MKEAWYNAFIAGFFDAEGCVALNKNKMTCQICFAQKQKGILEEIQKELEEEGIPMRVNLLPALKGGVSALACIVC